MSDLRPRSNRSAAQVTGIARHGRLKKSSPWPSIFRFAGTALVVVLVAGVTVSGVVVNSVKVDLEANQVTLYGETAGPLPQIGAIKGGFNVLVVGSDQCEEWDGCRGPGDRGSGKLNDVTMLLHVSEDQTNATAVSFPRDLVVPIPSCTKEDGSSSNAAMVGQPINVTLSYGGLACTVKTVENLTGLDIQFAGLITFKGVIAMTNAVGGVKVCLAADLDDDYSKIHMKKGTHRLSGKNALAFLRARHGVGDGSDLTRISSQQVYLSSLVRTLKSSDTLGDVNKVLDLATAASQNMQLSSSLASVDTMLSIALALRKVPLENVTFVQYPGTTGQGGIYAGKVAPIQGRADALFKLIKNDEPFNLKNTTDGRGAVVDKKAQKEADKAAKAAEEAAAAEAAANPDATASATATAEPDNSDAATVDERGQKASDYTCSNPR
jgi:LCP family protein required for cell wall assembly